MGIFKDIKYCFSFLTIFPVKIDISSYEKIATSMWLFPIVGFVLGLISSVTCLFLLKFLPSLLVGFLTLVLLLLMTGGHHTDGLIDFGDGLMAKGTPEHKIGIMHTSSIGAGGFILGLVILLLTGITISYSMDFVMIALIVSEIGAKFNMVAACSLGKSAKTKMADLFISLNTKKHMFISLILSIVLIYITLIITKIFLLFYYNISTFEFLFANVIDISPFSLAQVVSLYITFSIGIFVPLLIILKLSYRNFNGLTGDCLGALNEITRLFILILMLILGSLKLI